MIYFVMSGNYVKIGYTDQDEPMKRVCLLNTGSSNKVELLCTIDGDRALEQKLHKEFEQYRRNGEWFEVCPDIIRFIIDGSKNIVDVSVTAGDIEQITICVLDKAIEIIKHILTAEGVNKDFTLQDHSREYLERYLKKWKRANKGIRRLYAKYQISPAKYNIELLEEINVAFTELKTAKMDGIIGRYFGDISDAIKLPDGTLDIGPTVKNPWGPRCGLSMFETDILGVYYCGRSSKDKPAKTATQREIQRSFFMQLSGGGELKNKIEFLYEKQKKYKAEGDARIAEIHKEIYTETGGLAVL